MLTTMGVVPRMMLSAILAPGSDLATSSITGGPFSALEGALTPETPTNWSPTWRTPAAGLPGNTVMTKVGIGPVGLIGQQRIDAEPGLGRSGDDVVGLWYPSLNLCLRNATVLT